MVRALIIACLLVTSIANTLLFIAKWVDTDFDAAWQAFEQHVDNCLGKL